MGSRGAAVSAHGSGGENGAAADKTPVGAGA